ncbi:MAG: hypothetical protein AAGA66_04095 [Bacteroidota bacterium]
MSKKPITCLFLSIIWQLSPLSAQDVERLLKGSPISLSGSIAVNQIGYAASGIESRRDPYSFFASGGLTFGFYEWSFPFSFTYSNQQGTLFNRPVIQPFNQFTLSPRYRNYSAYVGYNSMTFSPYTLSGHIFVGGGAEASFQKVKAAAMYGRLRKAVSPTAERPEDVVYQRMGYGAQVAYNHNGSQVDFSFFRGKDDERSVSLENVDTVFVTPEENLAFGLSASHRFFNKWSLSASYALSALTTDTRAGRESLQSSRFYNGLGGFFTANQSTAFYDAVKLATSYLGTGYTVGFGYERVDPGYTSHGAYYFVNDLENITVNGSKVLAGGKVNVSASGGVQRDNLDNQKISTLKRFVGDASVGYTPSTHLNLSVAYSNFQTFTNIRSQFEDINQLTPFENLDTLDFTQISESLNTTVNYVLGTSEVKRQNIGFNASIQQSRDEQANLEQPTGSTFYLFSGNYSLGLVPQKMNVSVAANYNKNDAPGMVTETIGPSLSASKSLMENKANVSASLSWNQSRTNGISNGSVTSFRIGGRYLLKERHNLNLNVTTVNRSFPENEATVNTDYTELTATLGYSYSFNRSNLFSKERKAATEKPNTP